LRIGAKHREYEIADKFFAYILDVDFLDAEHLRLPARRLKVAVALTEVGGESDDFGAQLGLQPFQDDGGVEAARIGEYDLLYVFQLGHLCRFRDQVSRARYHAPSRFGKRRADCVARCRSNVQAGIFHPAGKGVKERSPTRERRPCLSSRIQRLSSSLRWPRSYSPSPLGQIRRFSFRAR